MVDEIAVLCCAGRVELFLGVLSGVALLAVLVLALVLRGSRRRIAAQQSAQEQQAQSHADQLRGLALQHADAISDERSRTDAYEAVTHRAMGWDAASRDMILDVCEDLGIDGVLLTNIVFVPTDAKPFHRYAAQIDHVLVMGASILLVESKRWNGVVFDGINPASAHPSFRRLLATPPNGPFALQIVPDSSEQLIVRAYPNQSSLAPAAQARRQAARLHHYLAAAHGSVPHVDTCVFYSHPDAEVFARPQDTAGNVSTFIAAGYDGLRRVLRQYKPTPSSHGSPHPAVLDTLMAIAADAIELSATPAGFEPDSGDGSILEEHDDHVPGLTIREIRGVPDWFSNPRHHE
ncbi:nuclease-related domain-containing protein [Curtobacterium sp. L1-20]|uniref:nuclease-related domain-containing protein n=1 Tax=Curtobacterium sp. L1-20 TaxID=3138181 RepID=UPI003B51C0A7